jgi:thiamine-phosphate pyrophosphorylase
VSENVPAPTNLSAPEGIGPLRRQRLAWARLYFVCEARPQGGDPERLLRAALAGGVGMLELREKQGRGERLLRSGETFRRLADTYGAPFIVNDDPALARELKADGLHLGQDDLPPAEARALLGPDAIIGLSTHSPEQIEAAHREPVDYISVGPVWETPTKAGRPATGLELIAHAAQAATLPWFAIGGIDESNVEQVIAAGAKRVCVVRAIRDAADPRAAAEALATALDPERRAEV